MVEIIANYTILILVQLIVLIIHALYEKRLHSVPNFLCLGVLLGAVIGPIFDIAFGKHIGLFSYGLGFSTISLILNAFILYALFCADIFLLIGASPLRFALWTCIIASAYEGANFFVPVWIWEFTLPVFAQLTVIATIYFTGAITVAIIGYMLLGIRCYPVDATGTS